MAKCSKGECCTVWPKETWSRPGSMGKLETPHLCLPATTCWLNQSQYREKEEEKEAHLELNGLRCCLPMIMRNLSLRENRRRSCHLHSNVILLEMALSVYSGFVACGCILRDLNLNVSFLTPPKSANIFLLSESHDGWEFVCGSLPQMEGGEEQRSSGVWYLKFGCKTALHFQDS